MKLPAPANGWRDTLGMLSPAIIIYLYVGSSGPLGAVWSVPVALMTTAVGWFAYGLCYVMVCQLFWPDRLQPHTGPLDMKPELTTTVLLLATLWVWLQGTPERAINEVVRCMEEDDIDPDASPADLARLCHERWRDGDNGPWE